MKNQDCLVSHKSKAPGQFWAGCFEFCWRFCPAVSFRVALPVSALRIVVKVYCWVCLFGLGCLFVITFDGTTACEKPLLQIVFVLSTFFTQVPTTSYK